MRVGRGGEELEKTRGAHGKLGSEGAGDLHLKVLLCARPVISVETQSNALRLHTHFTEEETEPQGG